MIYPTRRAILLAALGMPLALGLGLLAPGWWLAGVAWALFSLVLVLADAFLGKDRHRLEVQTVAPGVIGAGRSAEVLFKLAFAGRGAPSRIELALDADARLGASPRRRGTQLRQGSGLASFTLRPERRGERLMQRLWLRWRGPLGLAWKQRVDTLDRVVRVTPDVQGVKDEAIRMYSRDASFGMRSQREQGEGAEFQALREFQTGMDPRTIDWKQSARHAMLLAKEFRTERNHPIVFAIESGRLMCEPLAGLPRVDHALNSALLLAYVALKTGDRVGVFAFDAKPRLMTGTVSGVAAFSALQRMAAAIDYSMEEANYTLGLTHLSGALERRSLVVVFTDFADSTSAELMIENVTRLLKRHLVLFVVFRDEQLENLTDAEPETGDDISRAVIADALLREREVVIARLRRLGVQIVDAPAHRLGPELLSRYLDLKRRDML
ncbi:MAG: DUF58 domain-containing protein [Proteobacteria bacterium]|nr:DUF58 domain-containing protein [Pseudomonadota bacterium]